MRNAARPRRFKGYFVDNEHVFAALEEATAPITAAQIAERVIADSNKQTSERRRKQIEKRIRACLNYHRAKGTIQCLSRAVEGHHHGWKLKDRDFSAPPRRSARATRQAAERPSLHEKIFAHLGEKTSDLVLDILNESTEPLNVWQIAMLVAKRVDLEATNTIVFLVRQRVSTAVRRLRDQGLVRSLDGTRERKRWVAIVTR